ncbi:alpha-amylase family glycosyl hydrolase [Thioclava sp. JE_KL1]|uniref:alpha-amylase family glycosyl hydrolase n=1 Tax=Thioclava sp. JE_KL1 TaxID=2651187 RepID=UPI00128B2DF0|nr:alpha-amylase family glycosyl hydrolase [Thioclava sp. JE_KL1]MPQ95877.1 DUF3459 domain-containing protein [Thioclava sp. JE_KL1]
MSLQEPIAPKGSVIADRDWWRGAVIYQIYPRSFQDSNGDGIGDLAGIVQRLDHVASLGADAIWISPFFRSPMKDFGYDVSDYCDVEPIFGTLEDFDAVIEKAHRLGIRVLVDLVLSHSSNQHPWFVESSADRENPKADWYVWADPKPDGTPPNNWLSIFGGSAWEWSTRRKQYYLHNFLSEQPDLNFHNPDVRRAAFDIARFWLDRGVDGFRLDALNFYFHDSELRDNPALPEERQNDSIAPSVNPYNYQEHIFDRNRPENLEFVAEFRQLLDEYGAIALGEIGDAQIGLELIGRYTRGDDHIQMCYAYDFLSPTPPTASHVAEVIANIEAAAPEGWVCWAFSNHDAMRHVSRWNLGNEAQRLMILLMMCLRGSATIYQGEELGLPEAEIRFEDLQDPYGKRFWPDFKGRDGCRTPMAWLYDAAHAGFSTASRTWLPLGAGHEMRAVSVQHDKPDSLLNHYRDAIALRRREPALRKGALVDLAVDGSLLSFRRVFEGNEMHCVFNLSDTAAEFRSPDGSVEPVSPNAAILPSNGPAIITLPPWEAFLMREKA